MMRSPEIILYQKNVASQMLPKCCRVGWVLDFGIHTTHECVRDALL